MPPSDPFVEFREALDWAEKRGVVLPDTYYTDLPAEARSLAFTVSYIEKIGIIQQILDSLAESLDSGLSFAEWRELPIIPALEGLQPFHRETVYRNFMQTSFQAGHWDQFEKGANQRPYLLYSAILDGRETELCHGLDGIIRRVDDQFWKTHAPPNHHNCRSSLISLTELQAQRYSEGEGKGIHQDAPKDDMGNLLKPAPGWGHMPTAATDVMAQMLKDRTAGLSSISPDLADFFAKLEGTG